MKSNTVSIVSPSHCHEVNNSINVNCYPYADLRRSGKNKDETK